MRRFVLSVTPFRWPIVRAGWANAYLVASAWFTFLANEAGRDALPPWQVIGLLVLAGAWVGLYMRTGCAVSLDVDKLEVLLPVGRRVYAVGDIAGIRLRPTWGNSTTLLKVIVRSSRRARRFYLPTSGAQQERLLTEMRAVVDAYVDAGLVGPLDGLSSAR